MGQPIPLDYAPKPSWHRSAAFRRRMLLAFFAGIVLSSWYWGPIAWRRGQLWYWERQCRNYTAPADQVVLELDPERAKKLAVLPGGLYRRTIFGAERIVLPHDSYCALRYAWHGAPAFMGERTSRTGHRRLIIVEASSAFNGDGVFVREPNAGNDPGIRYPGYPIPGVCPAIVRIYAGQRDPADPSHFTIRCERSDGIASIDGWLSDDGQSVRLEERPGASH